MATRHKGPDSKGTKPGFPLKSGLLMADLTQRREAAKTQSFSFLPLQSTRIAHLWQNSSFSVFSCSKGLHLRQSASICGQFRIRLRLAALQCYFRELCIFDKVFPSLFSQFAPVQILWLRLAAPGLCLVASLRWIPYGRGFLIRVYRRESVVQFFACARSLWHFEPFRGKSVEVSVLEPFTRLPQFSRSSLIKPNQVIFFASPK